MPELEIGRTTLWYESRGEGRPIILLHSLAGDSTMWADILDTLSARGRVLALDARGHGRSPAHGEISVAQFARDAAELANRLNLAGALVVGLSMGGQAAMMLAHSQPQRVAGLVLADTSLGRGEDGHERRVSVEKRLADIGMEALAAEYVISRTERPESPGARAFAAQMSRMHPQVYIEQSVSIAKLNLLEIAREISASSLVLVGEQDTSTPPKVARQLTEALADARLEIIAGANHLSVLDQPQVFAAHVRQQLDLLETGRK